MTGRAQRPMRGLQRAENDAWQAAIADHMGSILVGHDPRTFRHLGDKYDDHRAK